MPSQPRDYLGRFIPRSEKGRGTYSVKDSLGRTQYFREGKRISADQWEGRRYQFNVQRRDQIARDNELRRDLGERERSRLTTQAEPRSLPPHISETYHGAAMGNHVKDMGITFVGAVASPEALKQQISSYPWLQLKPGDIEIIGIKYDAERGGYNVHYYANFASYYDDSGGDDEPPDFDDYDLFPDFGESPYE